MNNGRDSSREVMDLEMASNTINRLYNKLKQGYHKELFVRTGDLSLQPSKKPRSRIKMFPSLPKKHQSSAEVLENYLTSYMGEKLDQQLEDLAEIRQIRRLDLCSQASKVSNKTAKQTYRPNRINSIKIARLINRRRPQEPCLSGQQDIIITRRLQLLPPGGLTSRNSVVQPIQEIVTKPVLSSVKSIKRIPRKQSTKVQLPLFLTFQNFSSVLQEYYFLQPQPQRLEVFTYKAYIGPGNNSGLVKKLLKDRGYWVFVGKYSQDVNFVWTQTKKNYVLKSLKSRDISGTSQLPEFGQVSNNIHKGSKNYSHDADGIAKMVSDKMLSSILSGNKKQKRRLVLSELKCLINLRRRSCPKESYLPFSSKLVNHVDNSSCIGNKKGLLFHMQKYYISKNRNPFDVIPESVLLTQKATANDLKSRITFGMPCILKPAEGTNRGNGISIHTSWNSLGAAIAQSPSSKSFIVQRYLKPFLYKNRKFDIRVWVLWCNGQAWWYRQGYIRTSSKEFSLKVCSRFVHLTNDAVQKKSQDYGKYEPGNKLSFGDFQKYLDQNHPGIDFVGSIVAQMKEIAKDVFRVSSNLMDPDRKAFGYQLFGLDFMLDSDMQVWLIEANTNPCLETSCSILNRLIPNMLEGVFNLTLDVVFPPPHRKRFKDWSLDNFRFELIYDQNQSWNSPQKVDSTKFETDEDEFGDNQQPQ